MIDVRYQVGKIITWITGVETIKRQSRAEYGCLVAGRSPLAWA